MDEAEKITFVRGIRLAEESHWVCYMFGSEPPYGMTWRPAKDNVPCWFWRKMQYICFGNRWVKVGKNG